MLPLSPRTRHHTAALVLALSVALGAGACSTTDHLEEFNQIEMGNATPAQVPQTGQPSGTLADVPGLPVAVVALDDASFAVQVDNPPRLLISTTSGDEITVGEPISLPASAGMAVAGNDSSVLIPSADGVIRVTGDGQVQTVGETGPVTAVTELADGRILTGHDNGEVSVRDASGEETSRLPGLTAIDQLIAAGDVGVAISRPDTVVASVYPDRSEVGPNLRGGKASANGAATTTGWSAVTDTAGNALQIFTTDPVRLQQYFPVGKAPWAVAIDPDTKYVWVTLTGENRVAAYDISSGSGREVDSYTTVVQPTSLALTADGKLIVGSGVDAQLQVIDPQAQP